MKRDAFVNLINNKMVLDAITKKGYLLKLIKGKLFLELEKSNVCSQKFLINDLNVLSFADELICLLESNKFKEYARTTNLCTYAFKKAKLDDILSLYLQCEYKDVYIQDFTLYINILVSSCDLQLDTSILESDALKQHCLKFNFTFDNVVINLKSDDNCDMLWYKSQYIKCSDLENYYYKLISNFLNLYMEYRKYYYFGLKIFDYDVKAYRYSTILKRDSIIDNFIMNKVLDMPIESSIDILKKEIRALQREVNNEMVNYNNIPF